MTTYVCDVDESGVGQSFVKLGFTDIVTEVGEGIIKLALASAATFATAGAGASTVDIQHGPIITESAAAASLLATNALARNTVLSTATGQSFIDRESTTTALSSGASSSSAVLGREVTSTSLGSGVSLALPSGRITVTLQSEGLGGSELFGFNDYTYLTSGAAQSSVTLRVVATTTAASQGSGQSFAVLAGAPSEVAESSANGTSTVALQANRTATVQSFAAGTSAVVVPRQFSAWVMNTESTAMSRYANLPVHSIAVIGGKVLGLGEGGLYEMAGTTDDDEAIESSVRTGKLTLGFDALKQLGDVVIGYICAGVMQVRISCYGHPVKGTFTYPLPAREAESPRANRLTPGKGMRSRYFQFEFFSDGAAFDIDTATVDVAVNTRRV